MQFVSRLSISFQSGDKDTKCQMQEIKSVLQSLHLQPWKFFEHSRPILHFISISLKTRRFPSWVSLGWVPTHLGLAVCVEIFLAYLEKNLV